VYDRAQIDAILDEALVCHVGFVHDGQPFVIPTLHARVGDVVYVHGSSASRMLRMLAEGAPCALTATLLDGIVLARSAFHHSANYRSVTVLGRASLVQSDEERLRALEAFSEHLVPGRWAQVRAPNRKELKATQVLALALDEASAKVRRGPPVDDDEDVGSDVWAGEIPLQLQALQPRPDPQLAAGIALPREVSAWRATRDGSHLLAGRAPGASARSTSAALRAQLRAVDPHARAGPVAMRLRAQPGDAFAMVRARQRLAVTDDAGGSDLETAAQPSRQAQRGIQLALVFEDLTIGAPDVLDPDRRVVQADGMAAHDAHGHELEDPAILAHDVVRADARQLVQLDVGNVGREGVEGRLHAVVDGVVLDDHPRPPPSRSRASSAGA